MPKLALLCLVLTVAALGACASKASPEDCTAACENVAKVALGEVHEQLKKDQELSAAGEEGKELVTSLAQGMLEGIRSDCEDECRLKGTKQQAQCLTQAGSMADLDACK